tara:strand:+ start:20616 stop:20888 length:273 start_codon:yes stop_codon:yes gene_type:complete
MADNPAELFHMELQGDLLPQAEALDRVLKALHKLEVSVDRGSKRVVKATLKSLTKLDFSVSPNILSKQFTDELTENGKLLNTNERKIANA